MRLSLCALTHLYTPQGCLRHHCDCMAICSYLHRARHLQYVRSVHAILATVCLKPLAALSKAGRACKRSALRARKTACRAAAVDYCTLVSLDRSYRSMYTPCVMHVRSAWSRPGIGYGRQHPPARPILFPTTSCVLGWPSAEPRARRRWRSNSHRSKMSDTAVTGAERKLANFKALYSAYKGRRESEFTEMKALLRVAAHGRPPDADSDAAPTASLPAAHSGARAERREQPAALSDGPTLHRMFKELDVKEHTLSNITSQVTRLQSELQVQRAAEDELRAQHQREVTYMVEDFRSGGRVGLFPLRRLSKGGSAPQPPRPSLCLWPSLWPSFCGH